LRIGVYVCMCAVLEKSSNSIAQFVPRPTDRVPRSVPNGPLIGSVAISQTLETKIGISSFVRSFVIGNRAPRTPPKNAADQRRVHSTAVRHRTPPRSRSPFSPFSPVLLLTSLRTYSDYTVCNPGDRSSVMRDEPRRLNPIYIYI